MAKLSAVLIVKNESAKIQRCLRQLTWADEIVVLDTGSTDNTLELCAPFGCKTSVLPAWEGFGKAKQTAVDLASNNWVLSIDADEVLSRELQKELQALRDIDFEGCAWRIKRRSFYLGKEIRFCGWQNDAPLRLFDRNRGSFTDLPLHESVTSSQPKHTCKADMHHHTYPTRESHYAKMRFYGALSADWKKSLGKRSAPLNALLLALLKFLKMYFLRLGWLDGWVGFQLCVNSSWGVWYKYHLLWKINR